MNNVEPIYERLLEMHPSIDWGKEEKTPVAISLLMHEVIRAKEDNVEKALNNWGQRFSPTLIGGDVLNFGYFALLGLQNAAPALQQVAVISSATLICGEFGGLINIFVAMISAREALQAYQNKDYLLAGRLGCDTICYSAIGLIMIVSSLATKIGAFAAIGAAFALNPWLLPLLFLIASLPLCYELGLRINNIRSAKDLGSQLQLDKMKKQLEIGFAPSFPLTHSYSDEMERFQADMGVEAALEVFRLFEHLQNQEHGNALAQIEIVKKRIEEWNRSLYIRAFQQALYLLGFCLCVTALGVHSNALNCAQNSLLAGANGVATYMDVFWTFKRNTPMVVPSMAPSFGSAAHAVNA